MKKLLLLWLFSGSLDCFCQTTSASKYPIIATTDSVIRLMPMRTNPDTLRATLIVYYDNGPAILHTKPGFVVRWWTGEELYLDDKKKVIKAPLEVLTYKLKKG